MTWLQTRTGRAWELLAPDAANITLEEDGRVTH
jgi:hypothetical protein